MSAFALATLGLALARPAAADLAIAQRFIDAAGGEILQPSDVLEAVEVVRWPLRSLADLEGWTTQDVTVTAGPDGLVLRATGPQPWLERSVDIDAAQVDTFRIDVPAGQGWNAKAFWLRAGEQLAPERSAAAGEDRAALLAAASREMAVALRPDWSGRIAKMYFLPLVEPGAEAIVSGIAALRYVPDDARWAAATQRPWRADLLGPQIGDLRNALLAPRRAPLTRQIEVGGNARLLFDIGVQGRLSGRVCFQVRTAPAASPPLYLYARCIGPDESNRWMSASADLSGLAGQPARLAFAVTGEPGNALPLWGNPEIVSPAAQRAPNVILISIDTLRADRLGVYGHRRATSPQLDEWARQHAIVFDEAIAAAPWTVPSHVSMLSGQDPLRHGVNYGSPAPPQLLLLAEVLRERGYATWAVTGGAYLSPWVGLDQGFDRYTHWLNRFAGPDEKELATDVELASGWLREVADRPFFFFFHTYEVHNPYLARPPFFERFNDSGLALPAGGITLSPITRYPEAGFISVRTPIWGPGPHPVRPGDGPLPRAARPLLDALYDSGVAYMDQEIGRLLAAVRELGLDRRTLVIITSDHGEALGEHGLGGHAYLFDFNLRVPLLLALPDGNHAGQRVDTQVQSVDIVPTVLEVLGVPVPDAVDGQSLLPLLSARPPQGRAAWSYAASTNYGIAVRLDGGRKYVFNNSAWPPAQGQERWWRIDPQSGEERMETEPAAERSELRQQVVDRYQTDGPPALEIAIVNDLATEMHGRLDAAALDPVFVKALAAPPGRLRWENGGVDFSVPPGRRLQLFLEACLDKELLVSLDAATTPQALRIRERARLDTIALPSALPVRVGQTTTWSAGSLAAGTSGVELRRRGAERAPHQPAVTLPDGAREQLRALGYDP